VTLEKRVLALIGEVMGLLDLDEFCFGLLHALREAVPADWCSLNELPANLPHTVSLSDPPVSAEVHSAFARYADQNPIVSYFIRTRDGRATRFSDLVTRRELHRLELYREVYRALAVEYQIAFTLPSAVGRILGVALSRAKRDFTATERDLLNLARPFLIQAYRNALAQSALASGSGQQIALPALTALGLTTREAEVLRLVATGNSGPEAAAKLGMSPRTAQKHLERSYRKLDVTSRSQASRVAWSAAASLRAGALS
jgi:DNA-binding CsgD family transcriptional regulator